MRINRNGVKSLQNDINKLASSGIQEIQGLPRVKKYIDLLNHVETDDEDGSLFSLISEDTTMKLKFSQVERLLIQRHKLRM